MNTITTDILSGYLCICTDGYIEGHDGTCVDKNECNLDGASPCLAGLSCVNTVGSYDCVCHNLGMPHHLVPLFNQTFHYGLRSRRHAVEETVANPMINNSSDEEEPDLLGDIRFTRQQYESLHRKGVNIPNEFVDKNPILTRSVIHQGGRGADAMANLWKKDYDETDQKYKLPFYFDSGYPEGWKSYVREALSEYERVTCIKTIEVSENDLDLWNSVITVHLGEDGPNAARGCWSYVGNTHSGKQYLSLSGGCTNTKTVQHEFYHALGFWHEQQRADHRSTIRTDALSKFKSLNYNKYLISLMNLR